MTLAFGDFSKFQGPAPDYTGLDGVILNCTPQNDVFTQQLAKAQAEGKLIGYYTWPRAFGDTGTADADGCADALAPYPAGPVFRDYETGSFAGDPVAEGLEFIQRMHARGRGAHDYIQYSLIHAYDWSTHVAAGARLWFAEYTDTPDSDFGPWSSAILWQNTDKGVGGGDGDVA